jgi:hypothetical protein
MRETGAENEGGSDRRGQGGKRGKGEREIAPSTRNEITE